MITAEQRRAYRGLEKRYEQLKLDYEAGLIDEETYLKREQQINEAIGKIEPDEIDRIY